MRELVPYWRERFDWRAAEKRLNAFPQFRAKVGGLGIHFIHQRGKGPKDEHPPSDDEYKLPPFPQDKTVRQSVQVGGRTVNYDATVGSIPVLDEKGKTVADVMFIAYTVPGANRPVTFASL